eukprot:392314-Amphidinium_carterae.1
MGLFLVELKFGPTAAHATPRRCGCAVKRDTHGSVDVASLEGGMGFTLLPPATWATTTTGALLLTGTRGEFSPSVFQARYWASLGFLWDNF